MGRLDMTAALKKAAAAALCLVLGISLGFPAALGEQTAITAEAASAASVKLSTTSVILGKGEGYTLKATVSPSDADNKKITWSSSDKNKVSVSSDGRVKANNVGNAVITAKTANGKTASCSITVKAEPSSVGISKTTLSLGKGEIYTLSAVLPNGTASEVRTFRTSNSSVVKMIFANRIGQVKAVGIGTAWVTVSLYNGKQASCKINVKNEPTSVSVSKKTLEMYVGDSYTLSSSLPNGTASAKRTYRTSDPKIISMIRTDWAGQFKALKAGVAWVTVRTYNGKEASCKIRVKDKPLYSNKIQNYNSKVYYTPRFGYKSISGDIDMSALGSHYLPLTKDFSQKNKEIDSFIIYKDVVYYKDQSQGEGLMSKIYKCDMKGGGLKKIAENTEGAFRIEEGKLIYNKSGVNKSYSYDISTGKTTVLTGIRQTIPDYEILKCDGRWGVTGGSNFNGYIFYKDKNIRTGVKNNIAYYAKSSYNGKLIRLGEGYTPQF